jgi:N-acyl-D-amino-acid deacylase
VVSLLLRGATVYPGEGEPWIGDVAVNGDTIVAASPRLEVEASRVIELGGLALAPGFIDMHSHSGLRPFVDPTLEPKLRQGFTTELINPDGLGPAPVREGEVETRRVYLTGIEGTGPDEWPWRTIEQYLEALEATRPASTLCPLVPHGSIREFVMNGDRRAPNAEELDAIRREVALGMEAGCFGVSFGLIYLPAAYAEIDELIAVAKEAAPYGGFLVPHIRSESAQLLEAVDEMMEVSRQSGAPLNISHLKVFGPRNATKLDGLLELMDRAGDSSLDVGFDQYPYGAGNTILAAVLPPWMQEGGALATLERLRDPSLRDRIVRDLYDPASSAENLYAHCGPEAIVVSDAGPGGPADVVGRSIAEVAEERSVEPGQAVIDLLVESELATSVILHHSSEETVRAIARHPLMLVGTDGIFAARPHPRLWGTAPKVVGRFAIREQLFGVTEAIARLTKRAAQRIGLTDRGEIREGLRADLAAFDPGSLIDRSTYDEPETPPSGIAWVIVGGQIAVDPNGLTGERAGGVARRR